ncbi:MAG: hypothetical protein OEM07_03075, partial [Gammaproteobacteria bacterium]|nr:hypothetical protein [Gammaproteobacteria bacterium]
MKIIWQRLLFIGVFIGSNVWADEDHERARELVRSGEIIALEQLLQKIDEQSPGKIRLLEADLEQKKGRLVYELELVDEQGVVREFL